MNTTTRRPAGHIVLSQGYAVDYADGQAEAAALVRMFAAAGITARLSRPGEHVKGFVHISVPGARVRDAERLLAAFRIGRTFASTARDPELYGASLDYFIDYFPK